MVTQRPGCEYLQPLYSQEPLPGNNWNSHHQVTRYTDHIHTIEHCSAIERSTPLANTTTGRSLRQTKGGCALIPSRERLEGSPPVPRGSSPWAAAGSCAGGSEGLALRAQGDMSTSPCQSSSWTRNQGVDCPQSTSWPGNTSDKDPHPRLRKLAS